MEKGGWVYIMANRYRGGMYVGVTSDLTRRVWQHRVSMDTQFYELRRHPVLRGV
ncbi:MAG: GIY-YIG nuclease family protein, partial [Novosphingobium sp.]|uniref:GIY-YIG nuclease family protein n=1 Tax=Novosphingobium sp. TaxID=1874826 RepID=UPI003B991153